MNVRRAAGARRLPIGTCTTVVRQVFAPARPDGGWVPPSSGYRRSVSEIRVLLADDEAMIRAGLRTILTSADGVDVVAEAPDGLAAVALARTHRPDVAVLDIRMPRLDGLAAAEEIRRAVPGTTVLMLTTFGEDEYITAALAAGVSGFLLKSGDPAELIAAVRAVYDGAAYLSPRVAARVIRLLDDSGRGPAGSAGADRRRTRARELVASLSPRERDVLALLGAGLSNAEIGARLFLVEGTVKAYVSSALARLGVRNRVQAAVLAHEAGLVGEPGA
ncbi:LuxR family two component transcriptional regulator [Promicromonospora sp. AC04]|nr:LuxR family two component transcriptional regulator [Promicromonospora sp. AC04]